MERRGVVLRLAGASLCVLAAAACGDNRSPPTRLADGSRVVALAVTLEGVDAPVVATKAILVPRSRVARGSAAARCLGNAAPGEGPVVVRVGVNSTSVSFPTSMGRGMVACDGVPGAHEGRGWCGRAFGRLAHGHLHDPRLDLACRDEDGRPVGFAWIEPSRRAAYVTVEQGGYAEAYDAGGGLPVRVATTAVELASSTASFPVSEHDREGRLLRAYRLEPNVAG